MPDNFYWFFITALIPMVVGFIYYNPKVFGTAWMNSNGFTEKDLEGGNMPLILGLSYLFSVVLSFATAGMVIHQTGVFGMMYPEVLEAGSATQIQFMELMEQWGNSQRSFKHGVIHGIIGSIFFVLPIIAINSLFERRGFKYVLIHWGYWLITLALIGGVLCAKLKYSM